MHLSRSRWRKDDLLSEVFLEKLDDPTVKAFVDYRIWNHVGETRQRQDITGFPGAEEGIDQSQGMPEIDIVITGAMDQEQGTLEVRGQFQ